MDADERLAPVERDALLALSAYLEDPLHPGFSEGGRAGQDMHGFARLLEHHREAQLEHIDRLEAERGAGRSLRLARQKIQDGAVLDARALGDLAMDVSRDQNAREQQEGPRDDYLGRRDEEARRLAKAQGIAGRLRNGPEVFLDQVDRRSLRRCPRCERSPIPIRSGRNMNGASVATSPSAATSVTRGTSSRSTHGDLGRRPDRRRPLFRRNRPGDELLETSLDESRQPSALDPIDPSPQRVMVETLGKRELG